MRKSLIACFFGLIAISGCGTIDKQFQAINVESAELMPQPVAKKILAQYLPTGWIESPYTNCCSFIVGRGRNIAIQEIVGLTLFSSGVVNICVRCDDIAFGTNELFTVKNRKLSAAEAKELAIALRSMGARIDSVTAYALKK